MKRSILIVLTVLVLPLSAVAQPRADKRDRGTRGMMSLEELRKEPITFDLDLPYAGTDNRRQRLDVYRPKHPKSDKLPAIVYIHGGGWQNGDKSTGAGRIMPLMRTGDYVCVSIGYRLSGEAQWPAQMHDCKAAVRYVRANAKKFGIDRDRIGVFGRSAGGHLVLMLGVTGDVPEMEGDLGAHKGVSSKVNCVANYFGVSEFLAMIGQPSDIDRTKPDCPEAKLFGGPLREKAAAATAASPITYITANDPPVLTVHGTVDRTVPYDQAARLDVALQKAGVPSFLVTVEGAGHGDFGPAVDARVGRFFAKYLLNKDVEVSSETIGKP